MTNRERRLLVSALLRAAEYEESVAVSWGASNGLEEATAKARAKEYLELRKKITKRISQSRGEK